MERFIRPDWAAPEHVRACTTTRSGGVSVGGYAGFNLAMHVGDDSDHVTENRSILTRSLKLPSEPFWLDQVHGGEVVRVSSNSRADASWTDRKGDICAVLTADCLPLLMCDREGTQVAATHAGWRGLHAGVISSTVEVFRCAPSDVQVWLGPAIGPDAFEVGEEVFDAFVRKAPENASAFRGAAGRKYLCDLYQLARLELHSIGIRDVTGGESCTHTDLERFYSFRRDGVTGRMASLIWLE